MLSSLDFSIVVFMAESNGCIKHVPINMGPEKPAAVVRITPETLQRTEIWFTQGSVITRINHLSYMSCIYIFDPADVVTFSEEL